MFVCRPVGASVCLFRFSFSFSPSNNYNLVIWAEFVDLIKVAWLANDPDDKPARFTTLNVSRQTI